MFTFKNFIDVEKEEAWLSDMSVKGWYFRHRGLLGYSFFPGAHGRYHYQIDYRDFKTRDDYLDYLALLQDAGWIHVDGTRWSGTQYFTPENRDATKQLFSDNASKAARYRRLSAAWAMILIICVPLLVSAIAQGAFTFSALFNPEQFYYTPGIWEKEGLDFLGALLFETPFALGRGYASFFVLALLVISLSVSGYYALKARSLARRSNNPMGPGSDNPYSGDFDSDSLRSTRPVTPR
ncbi:MAG: DUF2812 domain-containing protein [Coriobacteriales bacterium]|jgi:hypothetical protein|nr:DUF2812 domain-containing protein [Coriobacteriales bacterium]